MHSITHLHIFFFFFFFSRLALLNTSSGMLASWLRIKYPSVFAGAIAASAPILGFPGLPFYAQNGGESGASYWDIVSYDTTECKILHF
jgi:hypothetical protein